MPETSKKCPLTVTAQSTVIPIPSLITFFAAFHRFLTFNYILFLIPFTRTYSTPRPRFRLLHRSQTVISIRLHRHFAQIPIKSGGKMSSWAPVYAFVKQIPRGRVLTYGGLAKALRLRGGARTAGRAMAATPPGKAIPWHRVVGYGGKLLIREPYASLQRKLLESEGVTLLESRVDMKKHDWTPPRTKRKFAPAKK